MTVHLGKLVYDDATNKLVYDDSTGKLVFADQQMFSDPLSPSAVYSSRTGTSATSLAEAVTNMQAASWVSSGFPGVVASTSAYQVVDYAAVMQGVRRADVIPSLLGYTIKSYSFEVTAFVSSGAKLILAPSLYAAWDDITSAPSTDITGVGWVEVEYAKVLGQYMIVYCPTYALNDTVQITSAAIEVTIL